MGGLQPWHIILIVVVFLVLFGGKKLPDAARGIGRSLRILKSEVSAMHDDDAGATSVSVNPTGSSPAASVSQAPSQLTPSPVVQPVVVQPPVEQPLVQAVPVVQPSIGKESVNNPVAGPANLG